MGWRGSRIEGGPVGLPQHEGLILEGGGEGEEGRGGDSGERHHHGRGGREGERDIIVISCHCY